MILLPYESGIAGPSANGSQRREHTPRFAVLPIQ